RGGERQPRPRHGRLGRPARGVHRGVPGARRRGAGGRGAGRPRARARGGARRAAMDGAQPPARRCARGAPRRVARLGRRAARRAAPARRARAAGNGVTPPHLALGAGGEFDRLRAIFRALGRGARDLGDDCALLRLGRTTLALSIDASLEGVHFRTEWLSFREIGWRGGAAALSDLAAEGARPLGVLVSVGLPRGRGTRGGGRVEPGGGMMRGGAAGAKSGGARGLWLGGGGALAMRDLPGGLAGDAGPLAAASRVRVALELERIPCWPGVAPGAAARSGEEYELLVALPRRFGAREARAFRAVTGL